MTSRILCSWDEIRTGCAEINRQIAVTLWKPIFIVAPSRGGLTVETMMSHYFECTFFPYPHPSMPNDLTNFTAFSAMLQGNNVLVIERLSNE